MLWAPSAAARLPAVLHIQDGPSGDNVGGGINALAKNNYYTSVGDSQQQQRHQQHALNTRDARGAVDGQGPGGAPIALPPYWHKFMAQLSSVRTLQKENAASLLSPWSTPQPHRSSINSSTNRKKTRPCNISCISRHNKHKLQIAAGATVTTVHSGGTGGSNFIFHPRTSNNRATPYPCTSPLNTRQT